MFWNHLIQFGASERVRDSFDFSSGLQSVFAIYLVQFGTSENRA